MNKYALSIMLITGAITYCLAQSLEEFNQERLDLNKKGMLVLGTWAVANIAFSPFAASRTAGTTKYFHQMNGYWNSVNLVLAGIGYYTALKTDPSTLSLQESIFEQNSLEKILLLNTGLDVAYMMGGLYLTERSKSSAKNADRLKGFGRSLILQGAFLFTFDLGFYLVQKGHGKFLHKYVDQIAASADGFHLVWCI